MADDKKKEVKIVEAKGLGEIEDRGNGIFAMSDKDLWSFYEKQGILKPKEVFGTINKPTTRSSSKLPSSSRMKSSRLERNRNCVAAPATTGLMFASMVNALQEMWRQAHQSYHTVRLL